MKKILLASGSPRRVDLLKRAGVPFTAEESEYEEDLGLQCPPKELAVELAKGKAASAAQKHTDAVIIAADTTVVLGSLVLGKPHTPERAKEMLHMLSGTTHSIVTGYVVLDVATGERRTGSVETTIHFKKISEDEIDAYVETGESLDKAGAYAIQGEGRRFVEKYEGDYEGAVGLPVGLILEALKELGAL
mgnify:CR=1 FL=1